MDLITTHSNADFDALSSLVAAKKLYPEARLLLPGGPEKAVRNFLALIKDKIRIENEKTCELSDVTRLIIVDNRHASRIGVSSKLLKKKGLKVHIYDHHPHSASDIKADKEVYKKVGATISILVDILDKKKKLDITPLEATLMLLGIYEETGSLSYATTTKFDVDMVSKLLEKGANLNAVSSYLNRELSSEELSILIDLLESNETVVINGLEIVFASIEADSFDGEMGTVIHKMRDVENCPVIFAFFKAHNKIKVLARSRVKSINVDRILRHFSGGGHATAASAKINDMTIDQVKRSLLDLIEVSTAPKIYAKDIMSYPVTTVSQEEKVSNVLEKLKRLGYKGAPVRNSKNELVGMVTLGDLKKAIKSKLAHARVKGYTTSPLVTVKADTPLYQLKDIMTGKNKGRLPVIEKNKLIGIVTRTDVLRKVHSSLTGGKTLHHAGAINMSARMNKMLPARLKELISLIRNEAEKLGMNVFLVGGFVRDLVMGRKNFDLDIVVEGNAIKFGKVLSEKIGASLVVHRKFGTSTCVMDWPKWLGSAPNEENKFKIDIATARKESYAKPAALPTVKFSSLREDLNRRDFTINAMALSINSRDFGLFVDFFNGLEDLKSGIIRILHDKSFIDDPTRIFRAVRFEQRFGFKIDKHTEYLITHAVKQDMFHRTENQRIRDELILILQEENPEKAIFRMRDLHELQFIHPDLVLDKNICSFFTNLKKYTKWYYARAKGKRKLDMWLMFFMIMLDKLSAGEVKEVLNKFVFTRGTRLRIESYKKTQKGVTRKLSSKAKVSPSEVFNLLENLSHEVILCVMSKTRSKVVQTRIKKFFTEYNGVKLKIKGEDIMALDIKPGPRYRNILHRVLCAKVDGKLKTKRDELKLLKEIVTKKRKKA